MTLQEAIRSGRRFRRQSSGEPWTPAFSLLSDGVRGKFFSTESVLAEDWEIEYIDRPPIKLKAWVHGKGGGVMFTEEAVENESINGRSGWVRAPWLDEP